MGKNNKNKKQNRIKIYKSRIKQSFNFLIIQDRWIREMS